jgi:hypothetical protein
MKNCGFHSGFPPIFCQAESLAALHCIANALRAYVAASARRGVGRGQRRTKADADYLPEVPEVSVVSEVPDIGPLDIPFMLPEPFMLPVPLMLPLPLGAVMSR